MASGVLSMSRMVGGTFGVAALGALIATVGRSKLDELLPAVPAGKRAALADALGSGGAGVPGQVAHAVQDAYVTALRDGLRLGAAVALLGALLAAVLVTGRPVEAEDAVHAAVNAGEATVAGARAEGELVGETA